LAELWFRRGSYPDHLKLLSSAKAAENISKYS